MVFVPAAVAPAHDLHGYEVVFAWDDVFGDVKLCCHLAVLAVADVFAVDVEGDVGCG